jgi:diaminopimelate epimerase
MGKISFTKMVASGNDFVVIESAGSRVRGFAGLAKEICDRRYGAGADGLLVLEKSKVADIRMRIFNADGSEAEMCGNGARCAALYYSSKLQSPCLSVRQGGLRQSIRIETKAGVIESTVRNDKVKIKLTDPQDLRLDIPIKVNGGRTLKVSFINTGVPHAAVFVEGLDKIDVAGMGSKIRYHRKFIPAGTNVDFIEILSQDSIKVRTYERGVEDETLACGTGAVAAALLSAVRYPCLAGRQALSAIRKINVTTKSRERLKVYLERKGNNFSNVWLEGKAEIVYQGNTMSNEA